MLEGFPKASVKYGSMALATSGWTARAAGIHLYLYLIDAGVRAVDDDRVLTLSRRGAKLFVCAYGCQRRGLPVTDKATYCGLVVLTDLLNGCERFVALN